MIKKSNKFVFVLVDLASGCLVVNSDINKIAMEAEDQRENK